MDDEPKEARTLKSADLWFGIILPAICFIFDPVLLKNSVLSFNPPLVPPAWRVPILFLVAWAGAGMLLHWLYPRPGNWKILLLPGHLLGAVLAMFLAAVLLPLAVVGLMLIIGVLGLVPIVTAMVYLRAFTKTLRELTGSAARYAIPLTCLVLILVATPLALLERARFPTSKAAFDRTLPDTSRGPGRLRCEGPSRRSGTPEFGSMNMSTAMSSNTTRASRKAARSVPRIRPSTARSSIGKSRRTST
jgi:hypothetical protein